MAIGRKTGGRKKGTRNKASAAREAEIAASGLTPLEFLTRCYRSSKLPMEQRIDAAKAAAPYVHPKLAQVEMTTPPDKPFQVEIKTDRDFARRVAFFLTKGMRAKA